MEYFMLSVMLFSLSYSSSIESQSNDGPSLLPKFQVIKQWKSINFTWPSRDSFNTAVAKGHYVPENIIIAGIKYHDDHYFLTLPRMKPGVPVTLARIKVSDRETSPNLEPYPSWTRNRIDPDDDCDGLRNVQNIEIDTKSQLWILDTSTAVSKCRPKLIIHSIVDDRSTAIYNFPESVASKHSTYLYDLVVDETDGGYAYIADNDATQPGIIVFSLAEKRSWKMKSAKFSTGTASYRLRGIDTAGIALRPSDDKVDRTVYFSPSSSLNLFAISTTSLMRSNPPSDWDVIKTIGEKPSQTTGMLMDNRGFLYYGFPSRHAIARWDSRTPFATGQKLIALDDKYIDWPNSFAFDNDADNLTILTNRLDTFVSRGLDLKEWNFRLISSRIDAKSYLYDDNLMTSNNTRRIVKTTTTNSAFGSTLTTTTTTTTAILVSSLLLLTTVNSNSR